MFTNLAMINQLQIPSNLSCSYVFDRPAGGSTNPIRVLRVSTGIYAGLDGEAPQVLAANPGPLGFQRWGAGKLPSGKLT